MLRTVMGAEVSDGIHLKESPAAVQVKVTVSIGHGLSTLTEYCAVKERSIKVKTYWLINIVSNSYSLNTVL